MKLIQKIKGLEEKLCSTTQNLTEKTEEANKLKAELEKLKSKDQVKRAKNWCLSFFTALGITIAAVLYVVIDLANMG